MSLLKTFGVENQQMMFSELLDHITKDAVDDLFDADPSETALKIGAQLIVQIFFWMKENIQSHMLGTSEDTSTRAATRAEMETLEREDEAVPLTADVAVELRRILQHVYAVFEIAPRARHPRSRQNFPQLTRCQNLCREACASSAAVG